MYFISVIFFVLSYLIYKKYLNVGTEVNDSSKLSKILAILGVLTFLIIFLEDVRIQNETLNTSISIGLILLLLIVPIFYIIKHKKNKNSLTYIVTFLFL